MMAVVAYENAAERLVRWTLDTGDSGSSFRPKQSGIAAAIQVSGLSDSTAVLEGSNDGTNWFPLKDLGQSNISFTSDGLVDFTSAAVYLRPALSGGTDTGVVFSMSIQG